MTIFGPDLSSFQDGLDAGALDYPFVIAKCSEGTYYTDRDYHAWRLQAEAAGKAFIPYHFISGEGPAAQARALAAHIGDPTLPVMLDFEPTGAYRPDLPQLLAVADAMKAVGLRVRLAYVPRWYWQQLGSPTLTSLAARGIALVASAYPGGTGYPGDDAAGWQPYGGMASALYQYTDHAPVQGRGVDMNAFRGTLAELRTLLGDNPMAKIPGSIARHFPGMDLTGDFTPDFDYTVESAAIWADARAEAAYRQALDNGRKLDQLLARAALDVDALAAALAPKIEAGAAAGMPAQALADLCAHTAVLHLADALKAGGA